MKGSLWIFLLQKEKLIIHKKFYKPLFRKLWCCVQIQGLACAKHMLTGALSLNGKHNL